MWSTLALTSLVGLVLQWVAVLTVGSQRLRNFFAYLAPIIVVAAALAVSTSLNPFARLALTGLVLLMAFKSSSLLLLSLHQVRNANRFGFASFCVAWPGIDAAPFLVAPTPVVEDGKRFGRGMTKAIIGVLGFLLVAGFSNQLGQEVSGWLSILCLLTNFHLGLSDCLTELIQTFGWNVKPLFESPLRATSLSNFWSQRWNRPFVELNKVFFMPWLVRRFGMRPAMFVIFLISGVLHELAISYPAARGWGLPLAYFALQGTMVLLERKLPFRGPLWVAAIVLGPLPLLFHASFRATIILPFLTWTRTEMLHLGLVPALSLLIWILGIAQFCILAASFQVPTRLKWKDELLRLSSLNHKLMWTYGSFIVYTILSFGVLTLVLHDEILKGTRAGLALSMMMLLWWTLRLATDRFYFKSSDWPQGRFMQIGHVMLNCLFTFVLCGYGCVLLTHIIKLI